MARLAILLAPVLILSVLGTTAQADPGAGTGAGPPAQGCTLRPNDRVSPLSEWASCLLVNAKLAKAPAIGETVALDFEVVSQFGNNAVTVEVDLPAHLRWVTVPAGLRASSTVSGDPMSGGTRRRASGIRPFAAATPVAFSGTVTADAAGPAEIRVRAKYPIPGGTEAAEDVVFATIGEKDQPSILDITSPAEVVAVPSGRGRVPAVTAGASTQAVSCATGSWSFTDQNGVQRQSVKARVEALNGAAILAFGETDANGRYTLCFNNVPGGRNVSIRLVTINDFWRVRLTGTNDDIQITTPASLIADGASREYGDQQPPANWMRALHAFHSAYLAWTWVPGTNCWDPLDLVCRQVTIEWAPNSIQGPYYTTADNVVHLSATEPDSPHTVIHEIGHALMDDAFEDAFPAAPLCSPHSVNLPSSAGCAWTEGWALWFPASVLNDPFYRWPNGGSINLETPTWGTLLWGNGDTVEGRVAGALIDLSDNTNEAPWDMLSEGATGPVWQTFINHVSNNMSEFWAFRAADGYDTTDTHGRAALYQNTIDYDFRRPLMNYTDFYLPTPGLLQPHNYSYTTPNFWWSAVAVRPPAGANCDLLLFDDRAQTAFLSNSSQLGTTIDLIAVNGNRRPGGDYYPRVSTLLGTGTYGIELAQGQDQLFPATVQSIAMDANDIVRIRDVYLTAGVPVTFTVAPTNGAQNPELLLFASTNDSATWIRPRAAAVASSTGSGPGGWEVIQYTPTATGFYGLVLLNAAGSGTYNLSRN